MGHEAKKKKKKKKQGYSEGDKTKINWKTLTRCVTLRRPPVMIY